MDETQGKYISSQGLIFEYSNGEEKFKQKVGEKILVSGAICEIVEIRDGKPLFKIIWG